MPAWEISPVQAYAPVAPIHIRRAQPDGEAEANQRDAERHETGRHHAHRHQRIQSKRGADRDEEDDEHRQRAALKRHLERVALRDGEVLDDKPGGHRREQRLEPLRRRRPGSSTTHTAISTMAVSRAT